LAAALGQPVRRFGQCQLPVAYHGGLATVFFVCTLALAYLGNTRPASTGSVLEGAAASIPAPAAVSGCARAGGDDVPARCSSLLPAEPDPRNKLKQSGKTSMQVFSG
jgi:preprotein translocase subunit SecG